MASVCSWQLTLSRRSRVWRNGSTAGPVFMAAAKLGFYDHLAEFLACADMAFAFALDLGKASKKGFRDLQGGPDSLRVRKDRL